MNKKICREVKFVSTYILRPHSGYIWKMGMIDKNKRGDYSLEIWVRLSKQKNGMGAPKKGRVEGIG